MAARPLPRRRPQNASGASLVGVAGHARVVVAEELDARDAEHRRPRRALRRARRSPSASSGVEHAVVDLAEIAARREHEHDAMARVGGQRQRAADEDRFVVGVGVEARRAFRASTPSSHTTGRPVAATLPGGCYRFPTAFGARSRVRTQPQTPARSREQGVGNRHREMVQRGEGLRLHLP